MDLWVKKFCKVFVRALGVLSLWVNVTVRMSAPMCWHVSACGNWEGVGTSTHPGGGTVADTFTCRHIYVLTRADDESCLEAGMCWHVPASGSRHVPACADTSRCRLLWYQSYGLYFDTGMCWHMSAPGKVPTPGKLPTRAGMYRHIKVPTCANTSMSQLCGLFIRKLGCAGMCQHLERC